ncbi:MAG: hypothetical protein K2X57_23915 [Xanthobacteraceae bacterium]|nr:hypothetical protein [Xanthobacteraceae bacterium]
MTRTLLLLAITCAASPVAAEPCSTIASRYTIAETLRLATEDRPVNVVFDTTAEGVKLPDRLKAKFPVEMTVILQYQFERLTVKDDRFDVLLWFKGSPVRLLVPFAAIRQFWDRTELKCSDR